MKLYAISGLGADKRVFNYLALDCELIPIEWIAPEKNESIENYALRLSEVIDQSSEYGILGVSFGGLVAVEMSKKLHPALTILISSVQTRNELSPFYRAVGRLGLLKLLPARMFRPPKKITAYFLGSSRPSVLNSILDDMDMHFTKWALTEFTRWENEERLNSVLSIGGSHDKLISPVLDQQSVIIPGGEHFMIVDKAREISQIINRKLNADLATSYPPG